MDKQFKQNYLEDNLNEDYNIGFNHCKEAVLKLLEENKENYTLQDINYKIRDVVAINQIVIGKINNL